MSRADEFHKPSEAVVERFGPIADDACLSDQDYFARYPARLLRVRRFVSGEDNGVNFLNDPRGEPVWTMALRCREPSVTFRWFFYGKNPPSTQIDPRYNPNTAACCGLSSVPNAREA